MLEPIFNAAQGRTPRAREDDREQSRADVESRFGGDVPRRWRFGLGFRARTFGEGREIQQPVLYSHHRLPSGRCPLPDRIPAGSLHAYQQRTAASGAYRAGQAPAPPCRCSSAIRRTQTSTIHAPQHRHRDHASGAHRPLLDRRNAAASTSGRTAGRGVSHRRPDQSTAGTKDARDRLPRPTFPANAARSTLIGIGLPRAVDRPTVQTYERAHQES